MNKAIIFFYGIIGACGALVLELFLKAFFENYQQTVSLEKFSFILITSIIIEEFFKFLLIYKISLKNQDTSKLFFNSLIFGLGFSLVEILILILNNQAYSNLTLGLSGVFLLHLLTSGFFGYFLSRKEKKLLWLALASFIALTIHFTYNALIIYNFSYEFALIFLFFLFFGLLLMNKIDYKRS